MRTRLQILPCAVLALALAFVERGSGQVGVLPDDKEAVDLQEGERNPFARRGPRVPTVVIEDADTEENRIRDVLRGMHVSGTTEWGGPRRVLLGSYILEVGKHVPDVIENQSETLRVKEITAEKVELVFEEKDNIPETRTVDLRFRLTPTIRYVLGSRRGGEAPAPAGLDTGFGGVFGAKPPAEDEDEP